MNIAQAIKKMEKYQLKVEFSYHMQKSSCDNTEFLSWKLKGIEGDSYIENSGFSHDLTLMSSSEEIKKLEVRMKGWYGGHFSNPSDSMTDYFPGRYGMNLTQAIDYACQERAERRRENAQKITEVKVPEVKKESLLEEVAKVASVSCFTPEHVLNAPEDERKVDGMGIALSVWSGWNGLKLAQVMVSALEDSNYHSLNRDLEPIFRKHFGENWK